MYCPAHFEEQRPQVLLDLMAQYPLATIVSSGQPGLIADHIPLLYQAGSGSNGKLIGHVARSNPLWQAAPEQQHLLIFQGPSSYISPNWYASKAIHHKVVPTWNYAAVHVSATLKAFHEPQALLHLLNQLTNHHEASQAQPWRVADAPDDYIARLLEHIVGIEFTICQMQGKWKVSQNQPADNRHSVVAGLAAQGGDAASDMAELVRTFGTPVARATQAVSEK